MTFEIGYSPAVFHVLSGLHWLAIIAMLIVPFPLVAKLLIVAWLTGSGFSLWQQCSKRSFHHVRRCSIQTHGSVLESRAGSCHCGLPRLIYLSEYLIVLEFRQTAPQSLPGYGRRPKLILSRDALQEADFCRLQRYARFELQGVSTVS